MFFLVPVSDEANITDLSIASIIRLLSHITGRTYIFFLYIYIFFVGKSVGTPKAMCIEPCTSNPAIDGSGGDGDEK